MHPGGVPGRRRQEGGFCSLHVEARLLGNCQACFSSRPHAHPSALHLPPAGLCSITCSLILPTAFYSLLAWPRLRAPARAGLLAMLALALSLVTLITAQNVCFMVPACRRWQQGEQHAAGSMAALALGWP